MKILCTSKCLLYSLIFCIFKNPWCICPYVGIIQIRLWVKTFTVYSQLASAGPPVFICWGRLFVHVVIIVYRLKFVNHNSAFYDFFFRQNLPFYLSNSRIFLYRHSSTALLFPVRRISAIRIHCLLLFAITAVDFPDPINLCKVFCTCTADPRKNGTRNIVPYTEDRARKCCKRIGCKISCCQ